MGGGGLREAGRRQRSSLGQLPGSQAGATWREGRTHLWSKGGRGVGTELGTMDSRPGLASWLMSPWSSHASSLGSFFSSMQTKGTHHPWGAAVLGSSMRGAPVQESKQVMVADRMWGQEEEGLLAPVLHYSGGWWPFPHGRKKAGEKGDRMAASV